MICFNAKGYFVPAIANRIKLRRFESIETIIVVKVCRYGICIR
jgi:hypothetical protein